MSEKALAKVDHVFNEEERNLIRKTYGPNLTETEFALFIYTAAKVGLNPLKKQIYAVKRKTWNPDTRQYEERMTIQTGIDGFRAVSARNQNTIPGKEPSFRYTGQKTKDNPAGLESATAYIKVFGKDNQYHEVGVTARWDEYVPLNKDGIPQAMWKKMPHIMLSKCAEALLHRKCNPEDLSGIYTTEEMAQADNNVIETTAIEDDDKPVLEERTEERKSLSHGDKDLSDEERSGATGLESDEIAAPLDKVIEIEGDPVETTAGPGIQGRLMATFGLEKNIQTVKKEIPGAKVVSKKRVGKFGFLDEIAELKEALGDNKLYYEILSTVGNGSFTHANEITDRDQQVAFWKALKGAVRSKEGE